MLSITLQLWTRLSPEYGLLCNVYESQIRGGFTFLKLWLNRLLLSQSFLMIDRANLLCADRLYSKNFA